MLNWKNWLALVLLVASAPGLAAGERLPLWEADNGRTTVYLFGSIHVCNASCFPLPAAALRRLDASQTLVVELDPQRPEAHRKLLAAARLPAGRSLADELPAADWQALTGVAQGLGLSAEALAPMQPWLASTLLDLASAQQAGYDASQGIDLALMQRARAHGQPLEELETIDAQIAALAGGTAREQREALRLTVAQLRAGHTAAYLADLIRAWHTGDTEKLQRLLRANLPADSSLSRGLIEARNATMAERLTHDLEDGRTRFVVVGVAHLLGPEGIPALLARHGFRVRQIEEP